MKPLELIGKTYLLALDPIDFDVYENKLNFETLSFVFSTKSQ